MTTQATQTLVAELRDVQEIVLPRPFYAGIVGHAVRKLNGYTLDGETHEVKAFGMLVGRQRGTVAVVDAVFPLLVNMRRDAAHAEDMDELVDAHAIPSETPNEQRGWLANPAELLAIERYCDAHDLIVVGNYHTHRVPWPQDPRRDTCTQLDRMLAAESAQWTFIVSAVDLHQPSIRAFYEGSNEQEAVIRMPAPRISVSDMEGFF
jgi:proteasome lid subunit RPN8/RPN11